MALGKHLVQAVPSVYAVQCLSGKIDNVYLCYNYDGMIIRPSHYEKISDDKFLSTLEGNRLAVHAVQHIGWGIMRTIITMAMMMSTFPQS